MIFEKIRMIVSDHLGASEDEIFPESSLVDMGASQLDIVGIAMSLEAEFNTSIPDDHLEMIDVIEDVVQYIESRTS